MFGNLDANFSQHANLADITVKQMAVSGVNPKPIKNPNHTVDFELKDPRSDDGVLHLAELPSLTADQTHELLGELYLELDQPELALAQFERTLETEPNRFLALYGAGRAAEHRGPVQRSLDGRPVEGGRRASGIQSWCMATTIAMAL